MTKNNETYNQDLKKQREFVAKLKEKNFTYPLVATEAFVRGMRDSGYKSTATALRELVDNALQAQANSVDIVLGYHPDNKSKKKPDMIAVVDNGHGMDPEVIRLAVLWGGTHREGDRSGFGRYGFGLPSASVSIARKYTVISRPPDGEWNEVVVDLEKIANGTYTSKGVVLAPPTASAKSIPEWLKNWLPAGTKEHGTIIILEDLDRLSPGFGTSVSFKPKMLEDLGVVYRNSVRSLKLRVIDTAIDDGATLVEPIDPLFLMESARFYEENHLRAEEQPATRIEVKDKDDDKKTLGVINVRYAYLPPGFQNEGGKAAASHKTKRFQVMKEYNGLLVCRAGRQVDVLRTCPWLTFQNYDRNWKVEVDFAPALDEMFGVTTNKQQITVSEGIWAQLEHQGVKAAITNMRRRYDRDLATLEAAEIQKEAEKRDSEAVMDEAQKFETRQAPAPSPEKERKQQERLEREVQKTVKETGKTPQQVAAELLESRHRIIFETMPGAPFYRAEQVGGQLRLAINTAHRFYTDVYNGPSTSAPVKTALEILLFVLSECEARSEDDLERFYRSERTEWSRKLDLTLELRDKKGSVKDARAAAKENVETDGAANDA